LEACWDTTVGDVSSGIDDRFSNCVFWNGGGLILSESSKVCANGLRLFAVDAAIVRRLQMILRDGELQLFEIDSEALTEDFVADC
jgi:hypothetical protein